MTQLLAEMAAIARMTEENRRASAAAADEAHRLDVLAVTVGATVGRFCV